jgi:hypothetical protein
MNEIKLEFGLYPDEIADPSLVEAESMACEVPTTVESPLCDGVGFCDQDGCVGCSSTWSCFPIDPRKSWNELNIEQQEFIRTHYPEWVGR